MSYPYMPTVYWITPVFDRVLEDCIYGNSKGCIDSETLNRIENNVQYLKELFDMHNIFYVKDITTVTTWTRTMYFRIDALNRIKSNILQLRASTVINTDTPNITLDQAEQPQLWNVWNDMERILFDIAAAFVRLDEDYLFCGEFVCGGTKDEQHYEGIEYIGTSSFIVQPQELLRTSSGRKFLVKQDNMIPWVGGEYNA